MSKVVLPCKQCGKVPDPVKGVVFHACPVGEPITDWNRRAHSPAVREFVEAVDRLVISDRSDILDLCQFDAARDRLREEEGI